MAAAAEAPSGGSLQTRLDAVLKAGCSDTQAATGLLLDLAAAAECAAVIAVWDGLKARSVAPSDSAWTALDKLHSRGKGKIPAGRLTVASSSSGGRTLAPGRRLHKIMKGRRLSARSDAAKSAMGPAVAWVAAERAKGRTFSVTSAKGRISLAKELRTALRLPSLEVARGVVTKLKQKKLL
jgi:hypothetical protein